MLAVAISNAQDFTRVDSVKLSKPKLKEATMAYIAETWKSANDVIQLNTDDQIIIKGSKEVAFNEMGTYSYWFTYSIKFQFKDNKAKMSITDIYNEYGIYKGTTKIPALDLSYKDEDVCPSIWKINAPKKQVVPAMKNLENEFNSLIEKYFNFLNNYNVENDNW